MLYTIIYLYDLVRIFFLNIVVTADFEFWLNTTLANLSSLGLNKPLREL